MRTLGLLILWLVTTVGILITTLSLLFVQQLQNRQELYAQLQSSGVYTTLSTEISTQITRSLKQQNKKDLPPQVETITQAVLKDSLFTPSLLQRIVEKNTDNFFAYLDGDSIEVMVYIPISEINSFVRTKLPDAVSSGLTEELLRLPTCSARQTEEFAKANWTINNLPTCVPAAIKQNPGSLKKEISGSAKDLGQLDLPSLQDEMPLSQMSAALRSIQSTDSPATDPMPTLQRLRTQWQWSQRTPWIVGGVTVFCILLSFTISWSKWRSGVVWIATSFLVGGAVVLTIVLLTRVFTSVVLGLFPAEEGLANSLKILVDQIINSVLSVGFRYGLAVLGVSVVLFLPAWFWPRHETRTAIK